MLFNSRAEPGEIQIPAREKRWAHRDQSWHLLSSIPLAKRVKPFMIGRSVSPTLWLRGYRPPAPVLRPLSSAHTGGAHLVVVSGPGDISSVYFVATYFFFPLVPILTRLVETHSQVSSMTFR